MDGCAEGAGSEVLDLHVDADGFVFGFEEGLDGFACGMLHEVDHGGGGKNGGGRIISEGDRLVGADLCV